MSELFQQCDLAAPTIRATFRNHDDTVFSGLRGSSRKASNGHADWQCSGH